MSRSLVSRSLALLAASALVFSLSACQKKTPPEPTAAATLPAAPTIRTDGSLTFYRDTTDIATLDIEIADTDATRERGLMERPPLSDTQAMLFVFARAEPQSFWMANTPSPLDIVYVGADSAVVSIAKYTKPFSTEPLPSTGPAQYVVEVRAGWADAKGLVPGDKVRWTRNAPPMV